MSNLLLVHDPQRIVGSHRALNGGHRRSHDIADSGAIQVLPVEHDAIHQIAFAENSGQAVVIDNRHCSDMPLMHCAHRIHHAGSSADGDEWHPSDPQETHKHPRLSFDLRATYYLI